MSEQNTWSLKWMEENTHILCVNGNETAYVESCDLEYSKSCGNYIVEYCNNYEKLQQENEKLKQVIYLAEQTATTCLELQQENGKLKEALKELLLISKAEYAQTDDTISGEKWKNKLSGIINRSEGLIK